MSLARPKPAEASKVEAPPAPVEAPKPAPVEAPKPAPVEPLDAHEAGRVEARASFVADTAPEGAGGAPSPVIERTPDGKTAAVTLTSEQVAELTTKLFAGFVGAAGPRFLGGDRAMWAVSEPECEAVKAATVPVIEKYGASQLSPEMLLVGVVLSVILPRAMASMNSPSGASHASA